MPAPWERYQAQESVGPWMKYSAQPKEPFADYKPISGGDMVTAAAKQLGGAIISPITSIPSAAREVWDWAKSGFEAPAVTKQKAVLAGTSNAGPGEIGVNPLEQAEGNALTAAMIAGGPGAMKLAKTGAAKVADFATSPSIVQGLKRSSEGVIIGSAMHGNIPGMATGGAARVLAGKLGDIGKRRATVAPTPAVVETTAIPPIYEELARSQAGRPFSKLDPSEQAAVKQMAERIQNGAPAETPVAVAPEIVTAPEAAPAAVVAPDPAIPLRGPIPINQPLTRANIKPKAAEVAQQLHDEMAANGSLPDPYQRVAQALTDNGIALVDAKKLMGAADFKTVFDGMGQAESTAFSKSPIQAVERTLFEMKKLEGGAKAKPALAEAPSTAPTPVEPVSRTKGMSQAVKDGAKLTDKLMEWNFSPDEAKSMGADSWNKLAFDAGVPGGLTPAMRERVIFDLIKRQAGPPRTIEQAMEALKASLPKEEGTAPKLRVVEKKTAAKPSK